MSTRRWWSGAPGERFWLEATDRIDIGVDLRAPLRDAGGQDNWRYTLFQETREGDIVLHYDGNAEAITAWSTVAGPPTSQPIVWAARGTYARERGALPVEVDGYSVPLRNTTMLKTPVTLERIRGQKEDLIALTESLRETYNAPLYFPFELSGRPVRPMQGYAFKLPSSFLSLFGLGSIDSPSSDLTISDDRELVQRSFSVWQKALLEGAVREPTLWRLPAERFVFSNEDNHRSSRLGKRTALGIDPLGRRWEVQINEAEVAGDANVTTAVALDGSGRPCLIRQGRLSAREANEQPVSYETFRRQTGATPVSVVNGDTKIGRDWYLVTRLDVSSEEIRRNTSQFIDLCVLARSENGDPRTREELAVLELLQAPDELGGTYTLPLSSARGEREVRRLQGEVWQQMAAVLREHGAWVGKPRHVAGYEVDAEVVLGDRRVLVEIKSGTSAAEVYGGLGQLVLYRKLFPGLNGHKPVLLLPRLPSPALTEAVRSCGIAVLTYEMKDIANRAVVTFPDTFLEAFGISA